tara:strand:+ start:30568 stop:31743 length:1176 start_codon:yes stop_codon:yes gene_type:complete
MTTSLESIPTLPTLRQAIDTKALNGAQGSNRERQLDCQITANDDREAIAAWLTLFVDSPKTHRQYAREAQRLLMWAVLLKQKALSSLTVEDIATYDVFLRNPPADWCMQDYSAKTLRGSEHWRPCRGPLSATSCQLAFSAISSLMQYLVDVRYLQFNPVPLVRRQSRTSDTHEVLQQKRRERYLTSQQWQYYIDALSVLPDNTQHALSTKARLRLAIELMFYLSLRVGDLAGKSWSSLQRIEQRWWFATVGKGKKAALLPVSNALLDTIQQVRRQFLLPPLPVEDDDSPIIPALRGKGALQVRQLSKILKDHAQFTIEHFALTGFDKEKLTQFSSHWIRHIAGSRHRQHNIPIDIRRQLMRHDKTETTMIYDHLDDSELWEHVEQLSLTDE